MNEKTKTDIETASLRMSLLEMSISILESKAKRLEQNEHFETENDKMYSRKSIEPYSADDVIKQANKLYKFIKQK